MPKEKASIKKDKWYTRSIFSISDMEKSIEFYCQLLGLEQIWKYEEDKQTIVSQVNRGELELILAQNLNRVGKARVFVSLEPWELEQLKQQIEEKKIPFEKIFWGYPIIKITDPDGNELLFPLDDRNSG